MVAAAPGVVNDPDTPYNPNDAAAVASFWKGAVVTHGGGKQRLDMFEVLISSARSTPGESIAARNDYLDAELALAVDKNQRLNVLEQKLANAKTFESFTEQQLQIARGLKTDVLMATAARLEIEIAL